MVRFTQYHGGQKPSHYCGYAADFISQVLEDGSIDGAVYPRSCDSCRAISGYLSGSGKFIHQLNLPARRDVLAVEYLAAEIRRYQQAVEKYYGVELTDIPQRIQKINERNEKLTGFYEDIAGISYRAYLGAIHDLLGRPLEEQVLPDALSGKTPGSKRVYIVGSFLSNLNVVSAIEAAGMTIVGDNLPESKRAISAPPVGTDDNIYINIANNILSRKLSPTQNDFQQILINDLAEIRAKGGRGVIFVTQKYCEPYDYFFSIYKKMLDEEGIPVLRVTQTDSVGEGKAELAIEAFADIL